MYIVHVVIVHIVHLLKEIEPDWTGWILNLVGEHESALLCFI